MKVVSENKFQRMVASKNVRWDPQREEAAWRIGVLDKMLDVTETLPRELHDGHLMTRGVRTFWDCCTEAHNEVHRRGGYSPFQLLIGRSPLGLPLEDEKKIPIHQCFFDHR